MTKLMNVREVGAYLNIKQRKVYDLVHRGDIPCSRIAGKWIFPQNLVDEWIARSVAAHKGEVHRDVRALPLVVAGSHDPLLEWSLRQSNCGLALLPGGSLDGIRHLVSGDAQVCALHILDPDTGDYNVPAVQRMAPEIDLVLLEWAWRRQGLVTVAGNPLGLRCMADLRDKRPRFVTRESDAGTTVLLHYLLRAEGIEPEALTRVPQVARSQTDVGLAVMEGLADTGLAVEAVALQLHLEFIPLHRERFDLAIRRPDYFNPAFQEFLAFTRQAAFTERAQALGYDTKELGRVRYNAP